MTLKGVFNGYSIQNVLELLNEYKDDAKIISGGTDLVVAIRNGKFDPKVMIDISKIDELKKIEEKNNEIEIGSAATYTDIIENGLLEDNLYGLIKACNMVGSPQIRNKGTMGGNIANAAPAADSIPPLIALNASLNIGSLRGNREVSLEDYFKDLQNNGLKSDELLISVKFKKPEKDQFLSFSKLGLRKALAISRATISMFTHVEYGKIEDIVVASGSIGKYPMREYEVERVLLGRTMDDNLLELAVNALQESMDRRLKGRSTLAYKREAVISLLEENIRESNLKYSGVKL